ncbi:MAG: hypothetical protein Q8P33_01725, partial [bacterium]|nr:hypothetical protein [bacterium]
ALQAVLNHDYSRFVTQELKERQRFGYPPFKHVVMYHRDSSDLAQADRLRAWVSSVRQLYGDPTVDALPAQLVTKPRGKQAISVSLLTAKPKIWIRRTPADWLVDLDPESLYA